MVNEKNALIMRHIGGNHTPMAKKQPRKKRSVYLPKVTVSEDAERRYREAFRLEAQEEPRLCFSEWMRRALDDRAA